MKNSLVAFPIFSCNLVDRAIRSLSLDDNVHRILPVGSELSRPSTLRQVSDQDSVSKLQLMTMFSCHKAPFLEQPPWLLCDWQWNRPLSFFFASL